MSVALESLTLASIHKQLASGALTSRALTEAYLARIVSNLAMDRLRSTQRQRETYVGPWLPEPILTDADASEDVAVAESVSVAMLVVLETLSPLERAVQFPP